MKLSTYLKTNKIITVEAIKKFLLNKTVIVSKNQSSHSYGKIGTKFKITNVDHAGSTSISYADDKGNNIRFDELDIILNINEEIEILIKERKEIDKQISELEDKQKIMKELKMDVWDEDTYKVYKTLQVLKTKKSDIEKSKIISDLIKK